MFRKRHLLRAGRAKAHSVSSGAYPLLLPSTSMQCTEWPTALNGFDWSYDAAKAFNLGGDGTWLSGLPASPLQPRFGLVSQSTIASGEHAQRCSGEGPGWAHRARGKKSCDIFTQIRINDTFITHRDCSPALFQSTLPFSFRGNHRYNLCHYMSVFVCSFIKIESDSMVSFVPDSFSST